MVLKIPIKNLQKNLGFKEKFKKKVKFFTIEVYNIDYKVYLNLIKILKSKI